MFFFFKQKTAYEMRISDWSSDVCSSDLPAPGSERADIRIGSIQSRPRSPAQRQSPAHGPRGRSVAERRLRNRCACNPMDAGGRSEEHTSELQSLMRISYAVFCLKKKKDTENQKTADQHQSKTRCN